MLLILGEHDKGKGIPFHPSTVSGRRLRKMLEDLNLNARLENIYSIDGNGNCTLNSLPEMHGSDTVVALGKIVADLCRRQGIEAIYLPHPAARQQKQLEKLRAGLAAIKQKECL